MRRSLALALAVCGALGCADGPAYSGTEFDVLSAPPVPVMIGSEGLQLVAGVAVQIEARPQSSEQRYPKRTRFGLRAVDPSLILVYDGEAAHEFVLVGLRAGATCLEVRVDGDVEECIPANVQPPTR